MKKKYTVERCDNCGSLTDLAGKPLAKQTTWGVMRDGQCFADLDTRAQARAYARRLNDEEAGESVLEAAARACARRLNDEEAGAAETEAAADAALEAAVAKLDRIERDDEDYTLARACRHLTRAEQDVLLEAEIISEEDALGGGED